MMMMMMMKGSEMIDGWLVWVLMWWLRLGVGL
jgi:hypothetical protein